MGSPTFSRRKDINNNNAGIFILLAVLLLVFFTIHSASPPAPVPRTAADTVFSAERAKDYVNEIAKSPHSIGTARHDSVMQYIRTVCDQLGLQTTIQHTTSSYSFRNIVIAGKVANIIARIKGTNNSKAVLIMGHYDSQPNTPGAGDDGAGVSAMLETARALKASPPLQNDVIFLFTDGEEVGLLGAEAFASDTNLLHQVGLVLNYDNRGNSGLSNTFEVNPENGWVIGEFAKVAPYPVANSFSYEVYKRLPNYTDYTAFKSRGVTGLNSGFIEGFVNYHSMTDIPASLDLASVQHHGYNMLALVKHFGNLNLEQTKGIDISFFNFIGNSFIHYPASWNLYFVLLTIGLFFLFLIIGIRKKTIDVKGFLVNIFLFAGALIATMIAAFLVEKLIKSWYPFYSRFYSANPYNSAYYFFTITAVAICVFTLIYQWAVRKFSVGSLQAGLLFVLCGLTYFANIGLPTSGYLFFFPVLFLLIGNIIILVKNIGTNGNQLGSGLIYLIFLVPAIFLFAPIVYFSFIAFGLEQTFIPIIMLGILLGLLIPLLYPVLQKHRFLITNLSLLLALVGFVIGHFTSGFDEKKPLQTNLWYRLNADSGKASWVSDFATTDHWNQKFFPRLTRNTIKQSTVPDWVRLMNDATVLPFPPPTLKILKDTVEGENRKLSMHLASMRNALSMDILISRISSPKDIFINGKRMNALAVDHDGSKIRVVPDHSGYYNISYYGLNRDGVNLDLETSSKVKTDIILIDRSIGLDSVKGFSAYPKDIIPGPDRNSNTIQVIKSFSF